MLINGEAFSQRMRFLRRGFSRNKAFIMLKLLLVLIPFLAVYQQDLDLVFREAFVNDFMNYILLLPFLIGYVIFRKRKMLLAVLPSSDYEWEKLNWLGQIILGMSLLSISFLIYFLGSYTSYALEYHLLSLPVFVAGSIALVFNVDTLKILLFPIALLFFIEPYLIQLVNPFWADLSWISSTASFNLLTLVRVPANFTTILDIPTIEITTAEGTVLPFTVGVASSGLNSFMGFTVFAIFIAYILREPLWKKATLTLVGYPLLILLNTLRVTIILALAYQWGTAVAEIFHLTGGIVLVFLGTTLLLFIGEKVLKVKIRRIRSATPQCNSCNKSLERGYNFCMGCGKLLKSINHAIRRRHAVNIALVVLVTFLLFIAQTPPIAIAKSPTQTDLTTISAEEATRLLPIVPGWDLEFLYRDSRVERILKQDAALALAYVAPNATSDSISAYIFVGVQISTGRHSWESSLVTYPARYNRPSATVLDLRDIQILQDPAVTARFFAYQRPGTNLTEVVLYWFERVPFKINSVWDMRNVQISILSRTYDLARSGLISDPNDLAGVERVYLSFAKDIANYWQPIKTSSWIAAIIAQNADKLLLVMSLSITGTVILYAYTRRKERKANTSAYRKLSVTNKRIIDILHQTEITTTPTLNAIAANFAMVAGRTLPTEKLLQKLLEAEKTGLVKRSIANEHDEPIQTWKTQIVIDKT